MALSVLWKISQQILGLPPPPVSLHLPLSLFEAGFYGVQDALNLLTQDGLGDDLELLPTDVHTTCG